MKRAADSLEVAAILLNLLKNELKLMVPGKRGDTSLLTVLSLQ